MTESWDLKAKRKAIIEGLPLDQTSKNLIDKKRNTLQGELLRCHTDGPVVWERERHERDKYWAETNLIVAALIDSQFNSQVVNGGDAGVAVDEYLSTYLLKDAVGLTTGVSVLLTAYDHINQYESRAKDKDTEQRKGMYFVERVVNAFTGAMEYSKPIMVLASLGRQSFVTSEKYWYSFPHELIGFVANLRKTIHSDHNEESENDDDEESKQEEEEIENQEWVMKTLTNLNNTYDAQEQESCGGTRMFKLSDGKIIYLSQAESYYHRGSHFTSFNELEFDSIVEIKRRKEEMKKRDKSREATTNRF